MKEDMRTSLVAMALIAALAAQTGLAADKKKNPLTGAPAIIGTWAPADSAKKFPMEINAKEVVVQSEAGTMRFPITEVEKLNESVMVRFGAPTPEAGYPKGGVVYLDLKNGVGFHGKANAIKPSVVQEMGVIRLEQKSNT